MGEHSVTFSAHHPDAATSPARRPIKALLLAAGSQGDVRPLAALADRLRREGHTAVLMAPSRFRPLAIASRVPFVPLKIDMMAVSRAMADRRGPGHFLAIVRTIGKLMADVLPAAWPATDAADSGNGFDVVVHHPVLPLGPHLAERLGVPAVLALPLPAMVPTAAFASPVWSGTTRVPRPAHRASYGLSNLCTVLWSRRKIERWRYEVLGLPRHRHRHDPLTGPDGAHVPVLHAFSRHVLARPADWPDDAHVTGYWFLPRPPDWTPPPKLAAFIDAGEPPVYIGFGSTPINGQDRLAAIVEQALERRGARAIIASGHHGLRGPASGDRFLTIRHAPHDWLFPRVAAVVHHGGAGTTGAAAAAGRPQVICPVGIDQPFWARRAAELGIAAPAAPLRALTRPVLERALRRATGDPGLGARAAELGRRIRAEDGTGRAVALLEQIVAGTGAPAESGAGSR